MIHMPGLSSGLFRASGPPCSAGRSAGNSAPFRACSAPPPPAERAAQARNGRSAPVPRPAARVPRFRQSLLFRDPRNKPELIRHVILTSYYFVVIDTHTPGAPMALSGMGEMTAEVVPLICWVLAGAAAVGPAPSRAAAPHVQWVPDPTRSTTPHSTRSVGPTPNAFSGSRSRDEGQAHEPERQCKDCVSC